MIITKKNNHPMPTTTQTKPQSIMKKIKIYLSFLSKSDEGLLKEFDAEVTKFGSSMFDAGVMAAKGSHTPSHSFNEEQIATSKENILKQL